MYEDVGVATCFEQAAAAVAESPPGQAAELSVAVVCHLFLVRWNLGTWVVTTSYNAGSTSCFLCNVLHDAAMAWLAASQQHMLDAMA